MKTTDTYRIQHCNADGIPADYVDAPKNYIVKKDIKTPRLPRLTQLRSERIKMTRGEGNSKVYLIKEEMYGTEIE